MARTRNTSTKPTVDEAVTSTKYPARRKKLPASGLAAQKKEIKEGPPRIRYDYNPHLPPVLRFDATGASDALPELLAKARRQALNDDEVATLAQALRNHEPWLEWSGKREKPWFEVDPVALHMHERVSAQAILKVLAREDVQHSLFFDPQQEYDAAVQAYKHDVDWANRMILGDSLQVMASLARREDLAGKVQMIYLDPPYGIKFGSNFQPQLGQRDVKDREQDLTREPEMVKAYRDTWTLGVHSYLAYLRDRLAMARELLADTGSIFVQISDENLHRVRLVMDEVFGTENFVSIICVKKTGSKGSQYLDAIFDYLLWYARDFDHVKYQPLLSEKEIGVGKGTGERYDQVEFRDGARRALTLAEKEKPELLQPVLETGARLFQLTALISESSSDSTTFEANFEGRTFHRTNWKTNKTGFDRLIGAERIVVGETTLRYLRCFDDFAATPIANFWDDTGLSDKIYVVQTATKVIERCMLMTTDPGDLVLDPTCGSGTTAYVAEQWGRRWITIDTSRVAIALARQRLLTARFPLYKLRPLDAEDVQRNPRGAWLAPSPQRGEGRGEGGRMTFQCKTVPHITLKSIARNAALDPIFARHEPILQAKLAELNAALKLVTPEIRTALQAKLAARQKHEGKKAITEADRRRWVLPKDEWKEWQAPYDADTDWPPALREALIAYRAAWRAKMDEVNACISASAESEELVDKPEEVKGVVRVSGTFTVESVIALEEGPDQNPEATSQITEWRGELDTFDGDAAVQNAEAHLDKIIRLLRASGVDFRNNTNVAFAALEPLQGVEFLHAQGAWLDGDGRERRVAVSIGPEVGNLSRHQTKAAIRAALRGRYDDLAFAAFGFDAPAQDDIEEQNSDEMRIHMALIRPDVAMTNLLKTQPGSQIFTVFSAPRVSLAKDEGGSATVTMEGMDVYDPVTNTLHPTGASGVAAWFVDGDYDGRTFCITQAFFPDKAKWDKLARALGNAGVIDEGAFEALSGTTSLPITRPSDKREGAGWRIAVKVIDPRGNEGMRVLLVEG